MQIMWLLHLKAITAKDIKQNSNISLIAKTEKDNSHSRTHIIRYDLSSQHLALYIVLQKIDFGGYNPRTRRRIQFHSYKHQCITIS